MHVCENKSFRTNEDDSFKQMISGVTLVTFNSLKINLLIRVSCYDIRQFLIVRQVFFTKLLYLASGYK